MYRSAGGVRSNRRTHTTAKAAMAKIATTIPTSHLDDRNVRRFGGLFMTNFDVLLAESPAC